MEVENSSGAQIGTAVTAGDGSYDVTGLTEGTYVVQFNPSSNEQLGTEYYNGETTLGTADPVDVTPGATTPGIDGSLPTGHISGTVTAASGAPIDNATVTAYDSNGAQVTSTTTASDGTYTLTGLATGSYTVSFDPAGQNFVAAYYNGKSEFDTADPVAVTGGASTAGINEALAPGASVSGTVSGAGAGALQNAPVSLLDASGQPSQYCQQFGPNTCTTTTGAGGTYTIQGLPAGSYYVEFGAPNAQNYLTQYYNGETAFGTADTLSLTSGQAAGGINATLAVGGQIAGTATDATTGAPVPGVDVIAFDSSGNDAGEATTAAGGTYTIMGLKSGSYRVEFFGGGYADEYYGGTASQRTSTPVGVAQGSTTSAINQALIPDSSAAKITGTVTSSATGLPISGATVSIYDAAGNALGTAATTRSDGTYTVTGLLPGSYKVGFSTNANFGFQYYNGKSTLGTADLVSIAGGGPRPTSMPPSARAGR